MIWLLACCACAVAVVTDLRTRRIPNAITLTLIIASPFVALARGGIAAALTDVLVIAAVLACGLAIHRTGWLGGGDIKLAVGIAGLIGYPSCIDFLLLSGVFGGVLAVVWAVLRGRTSQLRAQLHGAALAAFTQTATVTPVALSPQDARIPYALAFAAGLTCAIVLDIGFPSLRIWR